MATELDPNDVQAFLDWKRQQEQDKEDEAIFAWQDWSHKHPQIVWAVGPDPLTAIQSLADSPYCKWGVVEVVEELSEQYDATNLEVTYHWGYRFTAGGTGFKAAGRFVPGGAVVTWWS